MAPGDAVDARTLRRRLLAWYDRHGRRHLPWQRSRDPYRIWVSEIMLQQTQVSTVIPYYEKFLKRFPDVRALARARPDTLLHHWTGLGYYARARNLKQAAATIVREHAGRFPRTIEDVAALPGIGRSTAGAILAFAYGQHHPILDGNVKRVLTRLHAIGTPVNERRTETQLWELAERYTPAARVADYTQAIMDLGATVCRPRRPDCPACPLRSSCRARADGQPEQFPVRASRKPLPEKHTTMLLIRDARGRVLLTRRPPAGLWGGLWGFPECESPAQAAAHCREALGLKVVAGTPWPELRHSFSHFHLRIRPLPLRVTGAAGAVREGLPAAWVDPARPAMRGLATPVRKLLARLGEP
jgi:A/G-specific adenine glycosylase